MPGKEDVTRLLQDLGAGKEGADAELLSLVYDELRALAGYYMRRERPGHTLQTTALVHEAYLRLAGEREIPWESRAHYFRVAARAMRRVLIDHARLKKTGKKGAGRRRDPLDEAAVFMEESSTDLVALDQALSRLVEVDPRLVQVVELRFFGGLSIEDTARILNISPRTVKREWQTARVWLKREIDK
jgi:RNA polymerase sigma factor (TIGR02999 family)